MQDWSKNMLLSLHEDFFWHQIGFGRDPLFEKYEKMQWLKSNIFLGEIKSERSSCGKKAWRVVVLVVKKK